MKDEYKDLKCLFIELYSKYADILDLDSLPDPPDLSVLNDDSDDYDEFGYEINFDIDFDFN